MALIGSGVIGTNPGFKYELYADQTSGSGTNRTLSISVKLMVNGSYGSHGFWGNYRLKVKDTWDDGWTQFKGNTWWYVSDGFRTFSKTVTANVGTTSSLSVPITLYIDAGDTDNSCDGNATHNYTVTSTNTAPVLSGAVNLSPTNIPENQTYIDLSGWSYTDAESNINGICVYRYVNGAYNTRFDVAQATTFRDTGLASFGEGTVFSYEVWAKDSVGAYSNSIKSGNATKNTLIAPVLSSSSTVNWSSTSFDITWTAATNKLTMSDSTMNYTLSCTNSGLKIYNDTFTGTTRNVKIVTTAPVDGSTYILKNDLKTAFSSSNYNGSLNLVLTAKNAYGSSKTSSKSIAVDLRSTPTVPASCTLSTTASAFVSVYNVSGGTTTKYCVPDSNKGIVVNWGASTDALGGAITYDLFYKIDSGTYDILVSNTSLLTYTHVLEKRTKSETITYKVVAKTTYGYSSYKESTAQALYYYDNAVFVQDVITRADTTASVSFIVSTNTNLPVTVNTVGSWTCTNGQSSASLGTVQTVQTISLTGLTGSSSYNLTITYNNSTKISTDSSIVIPIGQNTPKVFINKYGLGVGGVKATSYNSLVVSGSVATDGLIDCGSLLTNDATVNSLTVNTSSTTLTTTARIYNSSGNDTWLTFDRNTLASWRILNNLGQFRFQCDWNGSKGDYSDSMVIDHTSGDVTISKGNLKNNLAMSIDFLNNPTILANATDLNTVKNPGRYTATSNANAATMVNSPTSSAFTLDVKRIGGNFVQQELTTYTGNFKYTRAFYDWDGTWGAWLQSKSQSVIDGVATNLSTTTAIIDARLPVSGMYLATFEYNQNPGGSTSYWASYAAIVCVGVGWNGTALVDRITFSTLAQGGGVTSLAGTDFNWRATGGKDKALNSISDLRFTFTKNAAHNMADIIRKYSLVRLADL